MRKSVKTKSKITAMAVLAAVMLVAGTANATLITYSNNLVSNFNILNQILPIQKFDTTLGTLNSVSVTASVTTFGELGLENKNPAGGLINRHISTFFNDPDLGPQTTNGQFNMTFDSQTLADVLWNVSDNYIVNLTAFDGTIDYAGTSGFKTTYVNVIDSHVHNYTLAADLAKFTGTGNVNFVASGTAFCVVNFPGGNSDTFVSTDGTANVSVTYDYVADVPEPATMMLLAFGIYGITCFKRR